MTDEPIILRSAAARAAVEALQEILPTPSIANVRVESPSHNLVCPNCGAQYHGAENACPHCGDWRDL